MRPRPLLLLPATLAILLLASNDSLAGAVHWNNAAGGNWSVATNWWPAVVPAATDTAVIDLAGTYTVTLNADYTVAALRVNGAASGTQTLTGTSRKLTVSGPYVVGAQGVCNWTTCTLGGTGAITNEGSLTLLGTTPVTGPVTNAGTLVCSGTTTLNGTFTALPGSTLRVQGMASSTGLTTIANGFTNNGTIELTSSVAATYYAQLTVTSGTLVNAAGATIRTLGTAGTSRILKAALDNRGTVEVGQGLTLNGTNALHTNTGTIHVTTGNLTVSQSTSNASFTTSGTIDVPAGHTFSIGGPVIYNGGTLGGAGTVAFDGVTLTMNAPMHSAMAAWDIATSTINGPSALTVKAGTTLLLTTCALNAATTIEPGGTLEWRGTNTANGAISTIAGSTMRVQATSSAHGTLTIPGGHTNNGTLELASSAAGTYYTSLIVTGGQLVNAAGATIRTPAGNTGRVITAAVDNRGTIELGQALTINGANAFHTNTGTINLTTGNLTISQSTSNASFTTSGTINVPTGRTFSIGGSVIYNGGTLGGAGTVAFDGVTLTLNAPMHSAMAAWDIATSTINGPSALTVRAGTTLLPTTCTLNAATTIEPGGTLEWRGTSTLNSALTAGPGSTMRVQATSSAHGTLTIPGGFTNNGTLELASSAAGTYYTSLIVTGGPLVNAAGATIRTPAGNTGRVITATLDNRGTIEVGQALTLSATGGTHTNTGTISIASGRALTVGGTSFTNAPGGVLTGAGTLAVASGTFAQNGIVRPGSSPGTLTISGPLPCSATSAYDVDLAGETAGTGYDVLAVRDAAALAGAVHVTLGAGFVPRSGNRYVIATFASRTGKFTTVDGPAMGPGALWSVAYSDTDAALILVDEHWLRIAATGTPPAAREGHTAVFDSTMDRMIVFGGLTDAGVQNDVWVLTGATRPSYVLPSWVRLSPTGAPPAARTNACAVYDLVSNRMIVYGGDDGAAIPTSMGDAWVLTNADGTGGTPAWVALAPAGSPPARTAAGAVFDRANNRLIVYGGNSAPSLCSSVLGDAWVLANANGLGGVPAWTRLSPTGTAPSARWRHGAAYDDATGQLVVTGGDDGCGGVDMDTWFLARANGMGAASAWSKLVAAPAAPAGWSLARTTYDPILHWVDAFGGMVGATLVDSAYTLTDVPAGTAAGWWSRRSFAARPTARAGHSVVLNPLVHATVLFGGRSVAGRLNDAWRFEHTASALLDAGPGPALEPAALPHGVMFVQRPSPNPGAGDVTMAIGLDRDARVDLGVFDVTGRQVATLHSGPLAAGRHTFRWAAGGVAPGIYLVRLSSIGREHVARIVRLD